MDVHALTPGATLTGAPVAASLRSLGTDDAPQAPDAQDADGILALLALQSIGDGVGCTDLDGRITFLNAVAERLTGWTMEEALGRQMEDVIRITSAITHELIPDLTNRAVRGDTTVHLPANSMLVRRDGMEIPLEDSTAPIHDAKGTVTGAVIVFRDVTATVAANEAIARSAQHDFLTGLPNRMVLDDRIRQSMLAAPRHTGQVAVLFLDLDGFKLVNDAYGHHAGDRLLQAVATGLLGCVRASDTVSRSGGDEFVVLLAEAADRDRVAAIAKRMLRVTAAIKEMDGRAIDIGVSIGIAMYPADGHDAEVLINHADVAMYQAKGNGRSSYQFYDATHPAQALVP